MGNIYTKKYNPIKQKETNAYQPPTDLVFTDENNQELINSNYTVEQFTLEGRTLFGKVVYVYDGDTIHCVINLNNKLTKFICRLNGIDSPEICPKNIPDPEARKQEMESAVRSRNYLIEQVTGQKLENDYMTKNEIKEYLARATKLIWIRFLHFDKYGRALVEIYTDNKAKTTINQDMLDKKYAISYDGGTKKAFDTDNFN